MNEDQLQSPRQSSVRTFLCVAGPAIAAVGLIFLIVGLGSFFAAFGGDGPPRYFWCAFVGMPLLFVGGVMCQFGYLGAVARYVAGESAPVAKDFVNYMGENTQPGVKAVSKSVAEGIAEGLAEAQEKQAKPRN